MRLRCLLLFPLLVFSCFQAFAEKPSVRIILFTPSDRDAPGGAQHRLTQIADAADRFFFTEMKRWGYLKSDVTYKQIAEEVFLAGACRDAMRTVGVTLQSPVVIGFFSLPVLRS